MDIREWITRHIRYCLLATETSYSSKGGTFKFNNRGRIKCQCLNAVGRGGGAFASHKNKPIKLICLFLSDSNVPPLFQQHSSIQVPQQLLLLGDELISSWWMHTFVLCLDLEGGGEPTGYMKCYP
jgi:hypothetical protein